MSTSTLILLVCLFTCFLNCSASKEERAEPGEDVVLHCQGPRDADIELLEWTKPDLQSEDYVFFFRENHMYKEYQHPSFHGRVKLRDPTMTDGDASVILKSVTEKDAGTYECHVGKSTAQRSKRSAPELIDRITLKVKESDRINITAVYGKPVTLPCLDRNTPFTAVEWVRPDLKPAGYVFLSRDGQSDPDKQHPYYKNWVELKDKEIKDEDGSLVLKYAMTVDSGRYECYVNQEGTRRKKRTIYLDVPPPGPSEHGEL